MVGSSSQVKWCLQTKYQLLTRNLKICDGHPIENKKNNNNKAKKAAKKLYYNDDDNKKVGKRKSYSSA